MTATLTNPKQVCGREVSINLGVRIVFVTGGIVMIRGLLVDGLFRNTEGGEEGGRILKVARFW